MTSGDRDITMSVMKIRQLRVDDSSNVQSIGYNSEEQKLIVRFKSGGTYLYGNCTPTDFASLASADSVGKEMQKFTKHPEEHPFEKVKGADELIDDDAMAMWDAHLHGLRCCVIDQEWGEATLALARMIVQVEMDRRSR